MTQIDHFAASAAGLTLACFFGKMLPDEVWGSGASMNGRRRYSGVGALALYLIGSLLFFGRGLLGHFTTTHIGVSEDPPLMMH